MSTVPSRGVTINVFFKLGGGRFRTHRRRPRGPAIDIFFNLGGGRYQTRRQRPSRGPPSTSSSISVAATTRPAGSAPRGAAIDVFFNLGGGHCRTHRQHPPLGTAIDIFFNLGVGHYWTHRQHPQGAHHRRDAISGSRCQYLLSTPPRGHCGKHYHYWVCYMQDIL
jgi:hypothetical protein